MSEERNLDPAAGSQGSGRGRRLRRLWMGLVLLAAAGAAWLAAQRLGPSEQPRDAQRYLTQVVDRGDISRAVNASGTLNPVNLVQVGTQVSGTIRALHADFNSAVRAGQLLAELDPAILDAELAQAQAQVRNARSSLALARTRLERSQALFEQGYVPRAEVDEAQAAHAAAQASVAQLEAAVDKARTNRRNSQIRSPVAGIVVSREVSVGQTVAATLQTPVLFRIAQDLRDVQIEANVSEADVGLLKEGQVVTFTVDAFPERLHEGVLAQIRNNYSLQQNVVTYTAVVRARNEDLSLRPGMTGYVAVRVATRQGVLRIPNAALRYEPAGAPSAQAAAAEGRRTVWRLHPDGRLEAVPVTPGLAGSRHTEATGGLLREGDALVIGERAAGGGFTGPKLF